MSEGDVRTEPRVTDIERPLVVALTDSVALDATLTGGKAAALARGSTAGLAVLPGVVLTTAFSDTIDGGADMATSSMAGQFESIIGITGYEAFVKAVKAVLDSRERAGAADHPIAVLVQ